MQYQQGKKRNQMFATSLEGLVSDDSWARVVDLFVDALPINEFGFRNLKLNKTGNLPYHPSDLFKLIVYGCRKKLKSANQLHEATRINVEVMWLLKGLRPSARTINYFRSRNLDAITKAHEHFVRLLKNWKLIGGEVLAVDGTKIQAQNSLKNNFNAKKIKRHIEYIDGRIVDYLDQLDQIDHSDYSRATKSKKSKEIENKLDWYGDKRKGYEELSDQLIESGQEQISTTDPDAKAMITHRKNIKVGYNIQSVADAKHNLIVDIWAGGVTDAYELSEAAIRVQELLGIKRFELLADKGYHNGVELAICERRGVRPFVSPKNNKSTKEIGFRKQDFIYDRKSNVYICPAGHDMEHRLTYKKNTFKKPYKVKRYGTHKCEHCPLKPKCTISDRGRFIERAMHQDYVDRNNKRVEKYKDFYRLRQQIIEHPFGTWKRQWDMSYTLLKGKSKVEAEYKIVAIAYNLRRIMSILGLKELKKRLRSLFCSFYKHFGYVINSRAPYPINEYFYLHLSMNSGDCIAADVGS